MSVGVYGKPGFEAGPGMIIRFVQNGEIEATWDFDTGVEWIVEDQAVWVAGLGEKWKWTWAGDVEDGHHINYDLSDEEKIFLIKFLMETKAHLSG